MRSDFTLDHVQYNDLRAFSRFRPIIRVIIDVTGICLSGFIAYAIIVFTYSLFGNEYVSWRAVIAERGVAFSATAIAFVVILFLKGNYHQRIPFWDSMRNLVFACFLALLVEGFILYANKSDVSRLLTFFTWFIAPFICMFLRAFEGAISQLAGYGIDQVLIIGRSDLATAACRLLEGDRHLGLKVCGCLRPDEVDDLDYVLRKYSDARYVLVALSGGDATENAIVKSLRDRDVPLILIPVANGLVSGMEARYLLGEESILLIDKMEVVPRLSRFAKRVFDVLVSSVILVVITVPMLAVAAVIRRDGGPVFFEHERVGMDGVLFKCIKFRSMSVNAEELLRVYLDENEEHRLEWEQSRKLKDDPRVTVFGRFIRKTTIDELPQLINVLRGDMSLVGPRPVTRGELEYYGATASFYMSVRPGLTGLWQVSGRSDLSYEQRVRLDTWYVRNWTPWHDIAIILKTIPAVLMRRGAY